MNVDSRYDVKPPEPKVVGPDYVQSFDNMSATDFRTSPNPSRTW